MLEIEENLLSHRTVTKFDPKETIIDINRFIIPGNYILPEATLNFITEKTEGFEFLGHLGYSEFVARKMLRKKGEDPYILPWDICEKNLDVTMVTKNETTSKPLNGVSLEFFIGMITTSLLYPTKIKILLENTSFPVIEYLKCPKCRFRNINNKFRIKLGERTIYFDTLEFIEGVNYVYFFLGMKPKKHTFVDQLSNRVHYNT